MQPTTENGYHCLSVESDYGDVAQRWLIVYSQAAYHREVATLEKKIAERKTAESSLHQLSRKEFVPKLPLEKRSRLFLPGGIMNLKLS